VLKVSGVKGASGPRKGQKSTSSHSFHARTYFLPAHADDQAQERKFVMPVKPLPPNPDLDHLKHQAKDLIRAHAARDPQVAQRIREFHPRFAKAPDDDIFTASFPLNDAQRTIARERGFSTWARLKRRVERPTRVDDLTLPHHERIDDPNFRRAVDLLDAGDVEGLRAHLNAHPQLVRQHVLFEGGNYFRNPTLIEFIAENPIRRGALPANVAAVARLILDAGARNDQSAMDNALGLVCSGCVPRQCGVQIPLIDLLCAYGADPAKAVPAAFGEFEAVHALIRHGAQMTVAVAAALGRTADVRNLLPAASGDDRHRALALGSQFGHTEVAHNLAIRRSCVCCWMPAKSQAGTTRLGAIRTRRPCIRPLWRDTPKSFDYLLSAARD